jgi:nascent polypeptide-associated complex subunit beta
MDRERLAKIAGAVRTGGKGSMRRKKKAVHKTTSTDDKRLQNTLKRLGVNTIPGIEEVNLFKDGSVIHFANPKVQASIAANTYVVSGPSTTKDLSDFFPALLNQYGGQMPMEALQKVMAEQYGGAASGGRPPAVEEDEDDDVPELVENFDEVAAQ